MLAPLIASLLSPVAVASNASWFEIEVIVFKRDNADSAERWPDMPAMIARENTIDLLTPALRPQAQHLKGMLPSCTEVPVDPYTFDQQAIIDLPSLEESAKHHQQQAQGLAEQFQRLSDFNSTYTDRTDVNNEFNRGDISNIYAEVSSNSLNSPSQARVQTSAETTDGAVDSEPPQGELVGAFTFTEVDPLSLPKFDNCQYPEETNWLFAKDDSELVPLKSRRQITAKLDPYSTRPYLLDKDSLQLTKMAQKIRWFKGVTPILHTGWRQPVYARHQAKPMYLFSGQDFSDRYQTDGAQLMNEELNSLDLLAVELAGNAELPAEGSADYTAEDAINTNELTPLVPEEEEPTLPPSPRWEMEGLFKVYLNHYLFIETQFNRFEEGTREIPILDPEMEATQTASLQPVMPVPTDSNDESVTDGINETDAVPTETVPWLVSYPFQQHRRVRSKEIHYFDHPKMGIVVQIRRFKRPQE